MATFAERVQSLTALDIGGDDTLIRYFDGWLKDAVSEIVTVVPPQALSLMSNSNTVSDSSGMAIESSKILGVVRKYSKKYYQCTEIPAVKRGEAEDSSSMFYASVYDPVFYKLRNSIYVLPTPNSGNEIAEVDFMSIPNVTHDMETIPNFPDELEGGVVILVAIKAVEYLFAHDEDEELYPPLLTILKQDYISLVSSYLSSFGIGRKEMAQQEEGAN